MRLPGVSWIPLCVKPTLAPVSENEQLTHSEMINTKAEVERSSNQLDIVYVGADDLDGLFQRSQAIAFELARSFRVLHVNSPFRSVALRSRFLRKIPQPRPGLRRVAKNLWTLDFFPALPDYWDMPWLKSLDLRIAAPQLRRAIRALNFKEYVLWIGSLWAAGLARSVDAPCICYDCMDNVPAFYRGRLRDYLEKAENQLLSKSDLVIASSEELYAKCGKVNANVHLVRNGLVLDRFVRDGISTPAELEKLRRPILGYSGYIGHWLDMELLRDVAQSYSHCSLVMLGPVHGPVGRLSGLPNVHFLGIKPHVEVPSYLYGFDVCMIPFQRNDVTTAVNPVKFYEYCALGKPTVSIALPELEPYKDLCYLARSREEFLAAVGTALRERENRDDANRLALRRRKLAEENSWETRGRQLEAILLAEKQRVRGASRT